MMNNNMLQRLKRILWKNKNLKKLGCMGMMNEYQLLMILEGMAVISVLHIFQYMTSWKDEQNEKKENKQQKQVFKKFSVEMLRL